MIFSSLSTVSQVRDVQNRASSNQSKNSASYQSSSNSDNVSDYSIGDGFIVDFIFEGIGILQGDVLSRKQEDPWLVSIEMYLSGAYFLEYNNIALIQSARLNWGMFSTDLRYFKMQDQTGLYETLDWQVLQINLVNQKAI